MLTKYPDVRPKKGVKNPLKNVFMSAAYSENFFGEVAPNLTNFQAYFFWKKCFAAYRKSKWFWGGPGECSPGKFLKLYIL